MDIDIKVQIELLKELQQIDLQAHEIDEQLEEIPTQIEELRSEWIVANAELKTCEEGKAVAEKRRRELEAAVEDAKAKLAERESKLYAIKTNKEYQAALKEITDGKRMNKEREDQIIKLMEEIENFSQKITQLSSTVADKENECRKDEDELNNKMFELKKASQEKAAEVDKFRARVDKGLLEKYDFISQRYPDPLAVVLKGICQGCFMNIPPQMYIELLRGTKNHFCPSCQRFIYASSELEDAADAAEAATAEAEEKG